MQAHPLRTLIGFTIVHRPYHCLKTLFIYFLEKYFLSQGAMGGGLDYIYKGGESLEDPLYMVGHISTDGTDKEFGLIYSNESNERKSLQYLTLLSLVKKSCK